MTPTRQKKMQPYGSQGAIGAKEKSSTPRRKRKASETSSRKGSESKQKRTPQRRQLSKTGSVESENTPKIHDPIIHSIRRSQYFNEHEKLAVVIICHHYDLLRKLPDKSKFMDL